MPPIHIRYVVTVYGERKPFFTNMDYYNTIPVTAMDFAEERGVPIHLLSRLKDPGNALMDIVASEQPFAEDLAAKLREMKKYERVEVKQETIDFSILRAGTQ
ncbi:hypothetical protein HY488_00425 [Candidatus Woesearchaeota archaeon]|nr:hypothetical protein [Candidatus Woesearchaeota archaeon]